MKKHRCVLFALQFYFFISISNGLSSIKDYGNILTGGKVVKTKKYAKIPNFLGKTSSIVGLTSLGRDLYICTSVSGGYIYKISPKTSGKPSVSLWFNVAAAMKLKGRNMDFSNRIEGGIRSIAFHPNYKSNQRFYVSVMESIPQKMGNYKFFSRPSNYQSMVKVNSVVLEFMTDKKTGNPLSRTLRELFRIGFGSYFHVLKQMIFQGPFLLITHGDGAPDESVPKGGQSLFNGLGKIIRINPLPSKGNAYSVPKNNPFFNRKDARPEIFALGFHNPHNICLDKRGNLFVGDTGRDNVEEINIVRGVTGPRNYGWPEREGHFIQLRKGGVGTGVSPAPENVFDGFVYPSAVLPHTGPRGKTFVGQSIASACPIENNSELKNLLLYCNFPTDGILYYSFLSELLNAKTIGKLKDLTWARTFQAKILYDHDGNTKTKPKAVANLRDIVRMEPGQEKQERADVRFGKGSNGEIFWTSKKSGWVYVITNSV